MNITFKETKLEDKYPIYIPYPEMMEIISNIGGDAYALYSYYHSKGQRWAWRDANIAKDLGWSLRKMQRIKKSLKDAGFLFWFSRHGDTFYYIGKDQVSNGHEDHVLGSV